MVTNLEKWCALSPKEILKGNFELRKRGSFAMVEMIITCPECGCEVLLLENHECDYYCEECELFLYEDEIKVEYEEQEDPDDAKEYGRGYRV